MALNRKVALLLEKKRLILKEIEELQNMCKHDNIAVKAVKENEGSSGFVIRRVCEDCKKIVGVPTQQEIFEYLNDSR